MCFCHTFRRGGVARFRLKVWQRHITLSDSFLCGYHIVNWPPVPNWKKRVGRERPPLKVGGHVTPDSRTQWRAYPAPCRSLSSSFIPAGEGSEQPPLAVLVRLGAQRF